VGSAKDEGMGRVKRKAAETPAAATSEVGSSSRPKRKAVDDTEQRAKKARGETDLDEGLCWSNEGRPIKGVCPLMLLSSQTLEGRSKIAGFDIDFTVIKTASGRKFATGNFLVNFLRQVANKLHILSIMIMLLFCCCCCFLFCFFLVCFLLFIYLFFPER
jgi:hypothetical protein